MAVRNAHLLHVRRLYDSHYDFMETASVTSERRLVTMRAPPRRNWNAERAPPETRKQGGALAPRGLWIERSFLLRWARLSCARDQPQWAFD